MRSETLQPTARDESAHTQQVNADQAYTPAGQARARVEILSGTPLQTTGGALHAVNVATPAQVEALLPARDVQVTLPPQSLPQFIDTVFGEVLGVPYSMGEGIAERREVVSLRGPQSISNRQFFSMAQMVLRQYGVAVSIENGAVRLTQDAVYSAQAPAFIRTRTGPDTPVSSRPVIQFFPVAALSVENLVNLLDEAYPNRGSVRFAAQAETNTLMISGTARDVASAATIVDQLDRPRFAGGQIARIEPIFMSTEQLADSLTRVLAAEGYQVSNTVEGRDRAITILPVQFANQMLVFASDQELFDRAIYWVGQLDRASALGNDQGVFVYTVQNTSAEQLGALVAQVAQTDAAQQQQQNGNGQDAVRRDNGVRQGGGLAQTNFALPTTIGNLTIDPAGNRILYRGSPSEYQHVRDLLEQLDTPPAQVLVELTIAEVTLTDDTRFGIDWMFSDTTNDGSVTGNTTGAAARQPGGLGLTVSRAFSRGTVQAQLTAFASNNNLNILSTPRLVTRSGTEAEILVGTDVPIITSQRAADNQSAGNTDILQTVQYRQTGVILNVRPIVYGDDRIDIALYQEVSSQQPNDTAAISSPLILNRSVTTQLSLQEGMTAVIGGLIQDNFSRDQRGVPGLKDIPLLGQAFRSDHVTGDKVELLILVTPYIIRDGDDMAHIADTLSNSVNRTLHRRGPQVYTLYPWRSPMDISQEHGVSDLHDAHGRATSSTNGNGGGAGAISAPGNGMRASPGVDILTAPPAAPPPVGNPDGAQTQTSAPG